MNKVLATTIACGCLLALPSTGAFAKSSALQITSEDGRFAVGVSGYLQPRLTIENTDQESAAAARIKRARLKVKGRLYGEEIQYTLQVEAAGSSVTMKDAILDLSLAQGLKLRVGQFKAPFGRQELTSDTKLQFVDRSEVSDEFAFGRDIGFMLHGTPGWDRLNYQVAFMNGNGIGEPDTAKAFLTMARITANVLGNGASLSEGDVESTQGFGMQIGAAYAYNSKEMADSWGSHRFGAELAARYRGLHLQGEYFLRNGLGRGEIAGVQGRGFYGQLGYFVVPEHLEVTARYGQLTKDVDVGDTNTYYTAGVNYLLYQHKVKLQADYTYADGNQQDQIIRTQLQVAF